MGETRQLDLILNLKDQASAQLNGVSGQLEKMQPAFTKMAAIGAAAFTGISLGIKKTVDDAVDLGESINAVQVVFKDGADSILNFGKTANTSVGMANSAFNQMATITGALLKDTGKPIQEVANLTLDLTKRAADLASVYNTDVNDAMGAINAAIRGETEPIRRYAADVSDSSLQQYALAQGIKKSVSEMTQQEKKLLRVGLIMQQTSVAQGDFQNTSWSLANQQRVLAATFENISATIGATFIPIINDVLTRIKPLITSFGEWAQQNPELIKKIVLAAGAIAGLVTVVGLLGMALPSIIAGFSLLMGPVGIVIAVLAGLAAIIYKNREAIMPFIKDGLERMRTAWEALKPTLQFAWDLFKMVGATLAASLGPALSDLWNKLKQLWELVGPVLGPVLKFLAEVIGITLYLALLGFIIVVSKVIEYTAKFYSAVIESLIPIIEAFVNAGDNLSWAMGAIGNAIMGLWESIKAAVIAGYQYIYDNAVVPFINAWNWLKDTLAGILNFIVGIIATALDMIIPGWQQKLAAMRDYAIMIWEAIKTYVSDKMSALSGAISSILGSMRDSISGVLDRIKEIFSSVWDAVSSKVKSVMEPLISWIKEAWGGVKEFFSGMWDGVKKIFDDAAKRITGLVQPIIDKINDLIGLANKVGGSWGGAIKEEIGKIIERGKGITGVDDAIITPKGEVIKTNPQDFIVATKNPAALGGGGSNITINIMGGTYLDRNAGQQLADLLSEHLRRKLRI